MDEIKSKLSDPIKDWRRRSSLHVGEHGAYDDIEGGLEGYFGIDG